MTADPCRCGTDIGLQLAGPVRQLIADNKALRARIEALEADLDATKTQLAKLAALVGQSLVEPRTTIRGA